MTRRLWPLLAGLLLMANASDVLALTVSPMQIEMTSAGPRSRGQITVSNDSDQPMPVEVVLSRITLDENGIAKPSKAGEEFLVMPPQAMIAPGATQNFRVQWLGEPMLAQSDSFMLYVNQIPVKLPQGKSGVQVVMSMGVMINVAPSQGAPQLKVVGTGVVTDKAGKRHPTIMVENQSRVHGLLPQSTIHLASGAWSSTLTPATINSQVGIGLVQPGRRRTFVLPVDLPADVRNVQASLEYTQKGR